MAIKKVEVVLIKKRKKCLDLELPLIIIVGMYFMKKEKMHD